MLVVNKLCCKRWYTWEEEEQGWELILVLKPELEKELWTAIGVVGVTEVLQRWARSEELKLGLFSAHPQLLIT